MKRDSWIVADDAVRPAGKPGECFYCHRPLGAEHEASCVMRKRTAVVEFTVRLVTKEPEAWGRDAIEFHYNDSSWCADNVVSLINDNIGDEHCLCSRLTAKFVREATADDESEADVFIDGRDEDAPCSPP